jgi:DNA-binding NarL/FixJ family response regulator
VGLCGSLLMTIRMRAMSEEEAAELGGMARSRTLGAGLVRRAQIIRYAVDGLSAPEIAARMGLCGATVRFWCQRRVNSDPLWAISPIET